MTILVTGATGYIGKALSNKLQKKCRCVVRRTAQGKFHNEFIIDSLDGETNWDGAFPGCHTVIHLAGLAHSKQHSFKELQSVNVDSTINLAKQAVKWGIKRFVFVSSIGVNGSFTKNKPFCSNSLPNPQNIYSQSKHNAETALKKISKETGLELVIIRPPLVYGANAPGNFGKLTKLVKILPFLPFGTLDNKRDFISVYNLVDLLKVCATSPKAAGHTFLPSDKQTVSVKEFTNAIAKGLGKNIYQLPIPLSIMRFFANLVGKSDLAEQLFENLQIDSSNVEEILGWIPPYSMEETMASLAVVSS